jgi:hypothetical protein
MKISFRGKLMKPLKPRGNRLMRLLLATAALLAFTAAANAEIICTARGGCWETGTRIRLPSSPYRGVDTTVTDRANPGARLDATKYKYLSDTPGIRAPVRR